MTNKAPTKTTFGKDNQPTNKRGKAAKTLILETMRENALLGLKRSSTKDESEKAFFLHVAKSAFDKEDKDRNLCLSLLANKGWPNLKATNDTVSFEFTDSAKPHEQASQVLTAIADGVIPPDVGVTFITSIKAMVDIEEYTDLKARIEKLEKMIAGDNES